MKSIQNQVINWIGSGAIACGAILIAACPSFAKVSPTPFMCLVFGQSFVLWHAIKMRNRPSMCLSIGFICLDMYGILVRLT